MAIGGERLVPDVVGLVNETPDILRSGGTPATLRLIVCAVSLETTLRCV
jgi:hypothetical protein